MTFKKGPILVFSHSEMVLILLGIAISPSLESIRIIELDQVEIWSISLVHLGNLSTFETTHV